MEDMNVVLKDIFDETSEIKAKVSADERGIYITLDGYSDSSGQGETILVELENGIPRVAIWSDINHQDPTHVITMGEAREENREEDDEVECNEDCCVHAPGCDGNCTHFADHTNACMQK